MVRETINQQNKTVVAPRYPVLPVQERDCAVWHNRPKLVKQLKLIFPKLSGFKHNLTIFELKCSLFLSTFPSASLNQGFDEEPAEGKERGRSPTPVTVASGIRSKPRG